MTELSKFERETIIVYNEGDPTASVFTHNRALKNKLAKLAVETNECEKDWENAEAVDYIIPKSWVKIVKPRVLSEEQKQAAAERIKRALWNDSNDESEVEECEM